MTSRFAAPPTIPPDTQVTNIQVDKSAKIFEGLFVGDENVPFVVQGGNADGGSLSLLSGTGNGTGDGGDIDIVTGDGAASGTLTLSTADSNATNTAAGSIVLEAGDGGNPGGAGGSVDVTGGGSDTGTGGFVTITGGGSDSNIGGSVSLVAGESVDSVGGAVTISAGDSTNLIGGTVTITGGDGAVGPGSITLISGTSGIGINGRIILTGTIETSKANIGSAAIGGTVASNGGSGIITTVSLTTGTNASGTFTVTNAQIFSNDAVLVNIISYGGTFGTNGNPVVNVDNIVDGTSFDIVISNTSSSSALLGALKIFYVIM
jgi:hypothetical protein